jgi:hypothetical protein
LPTSLARFASGQTVTRYSLGRRFAVAKKKAAAKKAVKKAAPKKAAKKAAKK